MAEGASHSPSGPGKKKPNLGTGKRSRMPRALDDVCERGCRQTPGQRRLGSRGSQGGGSHGWARITEACTLIFASLALAIPHVNPLESSSLPRSQGAIWLREHRVGYGTRNCRALPGPASGLPG